MGEPDLVHPVQVGEHKIILAREVLVQRGLRDAGLGDDRVHADAPWPVCVEEPERCVEDALARGWPLGRLRHCCQTHRPTSQVRLWSRGPSRSPAELMVQTSLSSSLAGQRAIGSLPLVCAFLMLSPTSIVL